MKKSFSRILCSLLVVLVMLSFAACGSTSSYQDTQSTQETDATEAEQVTLTVWNIWAADSESNKKPFAKVLADFQAANPNIKLEVDATENETYKTKIKTAVASNEMPDIFSYWGGGMLKSFVDADKVLALDDYLNDGTNDKLIPGTLTNITYDGKVYGLPYSIATGVFFANKEMFEQNNLKLPETYSDLVTAVKAFRAKGITPMALGGKDRWTTCMYFDYFGLRGAGYQATTDALSKKGSWEDPGMLNAAKKFDELVKLKAFPDGAAGLGRDESEVPFFEGKIPMYVNGNWTCGSIVKEDSKVKDKIVALRFPVFEDGKGDANDFTGGAADAFCVSAGTKNKEEAVKTLKYICENQSKEAYLVGAGMPAWKLSVDESAIDPLVLQVVNLTNTAKTFTLWWNSNLEGQDAETYMNKLQELLISKITPEQFVKEMQKMNVK